MRGEYCVTGNIKPQILTVANIVIHSTLTPLMIGIGLSNSIQAVVLRLESLMEPFSDVPATKVSTEKNCLFSSKGLMLL